jgi:aspartate/glutamate racemase
MVQELKEILTRVEALDDNEQRQIANLIAQEIAWDNTLKESQDFLSKLAEEAIQAHKEGNTSKTDW